MQKLWLICTAMLCVMATRAQSYLRDQLFNYNLPTSTINVRDLVVYKDKRILIGGEFHQYSGSFSYSKVLRLLPTGAPDPDFSVPVIAGGRVNCVAIQPWDSAIIIAGGFSSVNGVSRSGIARLLPSGALDVSFNPGSGISGGYAGDLIVWAVGVRNDNDASKRRVIAGGQFNYFNGTLVSGGNGGGLVQLRTDGTLDAAAIPRIDGGPVYALTLDENGRILAGGEFYKVNGADCWRFVRINTDGTTDNSLWTGRWDGFNSSIGLVQVYKSKIYVGGYFTQYRGNNAGRLVRLNTDGSYDAAFNTGTGFTGSSTTPLCTQGYEAKALAFMSDDRVLVGGNFTAYKGNTVARIARLNTDGSFDGTCITGSGFDQCLSRLAFQGTDDSLVAAGFFTSFRGEAQGSLIRIRKPPASSMLPVRSLQLDAVRSGVSVWLRWQAPDAAAGSIMELLRSNDGSFFQVVHRQPVAERMPGYEWRDGAAGAAWYQLRVTDLGGRQFFSPVVMVGSDDSAPAFFPNPCSGALYLRAPVVAGTRAEVVVGGIAGPVLRRTTVVFREGAAAIGLSGLPAGTYPVTVRDENGRLLHAATIVWLGR